MAESNGTNPIPPSSNDDQFTDSRDGQKYKIVKIGNQVWMAENLDYDHEDSEYYNDDSSYEKTYGRLYGKKGAMESCPPNWHLPDENAWATLYNSLGGVRFSSEVGGKMKSTGTIEERNGLWDSPNTGATNESRFTALPGGRRSVNLSGSTRYVNIGSRGYFFISTPKDEASAHFLINSNGFLNDNYNSPSGTRFSVRCVRDN